MKSFFFNELIKINFKLKLYCFFFLLETKEKTTICATFCCQLYLAKRPFLLCVIKWSRLLLCLLLLLLSTTLYSSMHPPLFSDERIIIHNSCFVFLKKRCKQATFNPLHLESFLILKVKRRLLSEYINYDIISFFCVSLATLTLREKVTGEHTDSRFTARLTFGLKSRAKLRWTSKLFPFKKIRSFKTKSSTSGAICYPAVGNVGENLSHLLCNPSFWPIC